MNRFHAIDLYQLLPALYRHRDAERGYPLRALLEIVSDQVDIVKQDIDGLWIRGRRAYPDFMADVSRGDLA